MYLVAYKKSVEKELRAVPAAARKKIVIQIQSLANNPRPNGSAKICGADNIYRIRQAAYRVVYRVDDGKLTVLIIKIGHRREVYRGL
jgi:mRNA interferase RelE/StbE